MTSLHVGRGAVFRPSVPELLLGGRPVKLGGRALDVLCTLAETPGRLVTKRELMDRVWSDLIVEENNLQVQISTLRRVLGPGSIVTVSGRGYRLLTQDADAGDAAPAPQEADDARPSFAPDSIPLLERQQSFDALEGALADAREGFGTTCLVYGEAGIGKSSVCDVFLSRLTAIRVLRGGCEALLSPRPLGPVYDFVGQMDEAARAAIRHEDAQPGLFAEVLGRLRERPTVLLLEDLHWADEATLDLLKYLGRRVAHAPLLLILTYRDDELGEAHPLRQVLGDLQRGVVRIPLLPLTQAAVAELAKQAGRSPQGVLEATGGNPFYVTEILECDGMPVTVVDAVVARFARQTAPVRALMELASTLPGRVEYWVVEEFMDPEGVATQEALSSGLLLSDGEGIRFRHEIARRAIEHSLALPKLRGLHDRLLDFLLSRPDGSVSPSRLVHHAKAAGRSEDVLRYAPVAARDASRRGAHREAATLYASALEVAGPLPFEERARMLEACAWENMVSDDVSAAVQRYEEALALWRRSGSAIDQARVMVRLARSYWSRCRGADCERITAEAVALLDGETNRPEYLDVLVEVTRTAMIRGRNAVVFEVGAKALELASKRGDERLVAHLFNNIGTSRCQAGELSAGVAMLERSLAIGRRLGDEDVIGRYYMNLAFQLVEHRRYEEADRLFTECEREFPIGGEAEWYYWQGTGWQAHSQIARGLWDEADSNAQRALSHYRPSSILPFRIYALIASARLALLQGRPDGEEQLREATRLADDMGEPPRQGPAACLRCEMAWLMNEPLEPLAEPMTSLLVRFRQLGRQPLVDELGYWLWRCGLPTEGVDPRSPRGLQIAEKWQEAAAAWRALGCPLEEAQSLTQGDETARSQAIAIFRTLGAVPYLAMYGAASDRSLKPA